MMEDSEEGQRKRVMKNRGKGYGERLRKEGKKAIYGL